MAIVSSTFALAAAQRDGRRYVVEQHTDGAGVAHLREYLAAAGADHQAIADARAATVAEQLASAELIALLDIDGPVVLKQQTIAQFAARLRAYFLASERLETGRIAKWIVNRIEAGHITEAQMRNAFGLTLAQWTLLRAKLVDLRNQYNAVEAAKGE